MKFGCHGSVWTGTFDQAGVRRAVEGTLAAGYDVLELPLMDPYSFDAASVKDLLQNSGLTITSSLGLTDATDISSDRPESVQAGEAFLNRTLDVLGEIGATVLGGVIHSAMKKHMAPATATGRQNSIDVLRRLAERAETMGIHVSLEVVNRYETNLLNTARQAMDFVDEIDHPNVSIHLDTYHMNIEESGMLEPVLLVGKRLGYVHIGESHRGYLGSGTVDFDSFFRGLRAVGFTGIATFESFSSVVVDENLSGALGVWRNLWDDAEDLAEHAVQYMRAKEHAVDTIRFH